MEDSRVMAVCRKCGKIVNNEKITTISRDKNEVKQHVVSLNQDSMEKCQRWLQKCSLSDKDLEYSSRSSTTSEIMSHSYSDEENFDGTENSDIQFQQPHSNNIKSFENSSASVKQVSVNNSKHVIVGNITYITGPIHITQTSSNITQQTVVNQLFAKDCSDIVAQKINNLNIISTSEWLARSPICVTPFSDSIQYVIIAHTATEEGFTRAENTLLVRLIQTFNMESRQFDDIAYNFLVGSDGNVYEGRGWDTIGAHTYGYNKRSIGIAFIGCFMDHLPSEAALRAAKDLLQHGIKLGKIPQKYTLVGHCQCSPIESPGFQLFNEIKKWPKWRELTVEDRKV